MMEWQIIIVSYSCVASLTDPNLLDIPIKSSKRKHISNISCSILQESQQLSGSLLQKPGPLIIVLKHDLIYCNNLTVSA